MRVAIPYAAKELTDDITESLSDVLGEFWSILTGTPGEIMWDANSSHAAQQDLALFQGPVDPQLPLIDLGCGNGTQMRFLANHFARVMGTEISPVALEIARRRMSSQHHVPRS